MLIRTTARGFLLTCLTMVAACSAPDTSTSLSSASGEREFHVSGEGLFRGLYFGDGPVADRFDRFWELRKGGPSRSASPQSAHALDEIVESVGHEFPAFFGRPAP